ncbi:MAG: tetratricopeptide repeat protein [Anaerolineae bacterium]|jgi:tetratricopeptide (TPR) repeat protein|nr:tetratricopeptide repeat protein [Anaerolineae bacterium]
MHDSLDLDALQRQAQRFLRLVRLTKHLGNWLDIGFVSLLMVLILFGRSWFENATQFTIVFFALATPSIILRFVVAFYLGIGGVQRVNRYKPDFVQTARWNELIVFLVITIYGLVCMFIVSQAFYTNPLIAPLPAILLILPSILRWSYRRFYGWVQKNLPQSLERVRFLLPYNYILTNMHLVTQTHQGAYREVAEAQRAILSGRFVLSWNYISFELNNYAYTLIELGRHDEAIPLLEAALRINPALGPAYSTLAYSYLKREIELERAEQLIKHDLTYSSSESPILYSLALAQQAYVAALLKRLDQVEEPFELAQDYAAKADPANAAGVYWRLGETARVLGDPIRAYDLYSRTIETDPSTIYAQQAREQLTTILL